jgi:hypothetical protein
MGSAESRNVVQSVANVSVKASNSAIQNVESSGRNYQGINVTGVDGDVTIRGVRMDGTVRMSVAALLEVMQSNDVQQSIAQEMEQMAKASVSGINLGNSSKSSNSASTVINASVEVSNVAAQKCDTSAVSTQVINVADVGRNVTIEDVEMRSALDVIVDCRMNAIQGNSSIQDMQQTVKQAAISETVGFDPAAIIWAIVALIIAVGAVGLGGMYVTAKVSGPIAGKLLPFLLAVGILAGAAFLIMTLLSRLDQVQPPPGVSREDNILQYPFLDPAVVESECRPAVFTGREGLETPDKLAEWVKAYNERAEKHNARVLANKSGDNEQFLAVPQATGDDIADGPPEDAPLDKRWPIVTFAYLNQRTGLATTYAGEKPNQLRGWSQWGPTDEPIEPSAQQFGPNVYRGNPKFLNPTRYNVIQLLREGEALLSFLRCINFGIDLQKFSLTPDGMKICAAEIANIRDSASKDQGAALRAFIDQINADLYTTDQLFTTPKISSQALWHMLCGRPHTEALATNALDTAALVPTNLAVANVFDDANKVNVPNLLGNEARRVTPMVYQLTAVYRYLNGQPKKTNRSDPAQATLIDNDALAVWNGRFSEWKRKFEAPLGWTAIDTGDPGDPASWRDITLAFVSRLSPVDSLSFNATSPKPTFVSVWVWIGAIAVFAAILAGAVYGTMASSAAKKRRKDKLAAMQEEAAAMQAQQGIMPTDPAARNNPAFFNRMMFSRS